MTDQTDRALNEGALEIAQMLLDENISWIHRVGVQNKSVHIVPTGSSRAQEVQEKREEQIEPLLDPYPFTVAEWWYDNTHNEVHLVVSPYWPTGGQCSKEQLEQYDEFIEQRT